MDYREQAKALLVGFKGANYVFGPGVLGGIGKLAASQGKNAFLVRDTFPGSDIFVQTIRESLKAAGVTIVGETAGAQPNAPREDLYRIQADLQASNPDVIVSFGGGSTIDAAKAAEVLRTLGGGIDDYFGTGLVSQALKTSGKKLTPHVAIQTVASSAAHLTKYSNITDVKTGQKKLVVDEAIVPVKSLFDYKVTYGAPVGLTADGALDGVSHCLEVLYSAVGKANYEIVEQVAVAGIGIVVNYLPRAIQNPRDEEARNALCLATDMGGYAIMLGGTNGAHLNSFSFVDILSHGRACAMMNPYYTVFFAPAVQRPLQVVGKIYQQAGLTNADIDRLAGRELGVAVAEAMFELARRIGFPTRLSEVRGFGQEHIDRALSAARDPQLKSKLENMPVPLTAAMVDQYMAPVLLAARDGNLALIQNVA
ncbi:MAG TPA: iron-containing alcohol dehydrogenase [Anaerolineaceae bacterium]